MDEDVQHLLRRRRYAEALEQLFDRYEKNVLRMAIGYLRHPARPEDGTQDIFLKLWRALPDYDGSASPGTWLYTIARNTCISTSRSESYRRTAPLEKANEPASEGPGIADLELAQYLDRLPETQRTVI